MPLESLHSFHFLRPLWLFGLLPAAVLLACAWRWTVRSNTWRSLVDEHLLRHLLVEGEARERRWPLWALAAGWVGTCLALAGPAWERLPQPIWQSLDPTVVVLDLSRSMETDDLSPSRRQRARYELRDLLDRQRDGQIGLVLFSDAPFVAVPLTDDAAVVAELLPSLTANLMPADGDRADRAIDQARALLEQGGTAGHIVLMTDGLGVHANAAAAAAKLAKAAGHSVSVLGIASEAALERERDALEAIASAGGGSYADARPDLADLDRILREPLLRNAPRRETALGAGDEWRDAGVWLLIVPLFLAPLAFRRGWLVAAALWLGLVPAGEARAAFWDDLWQRRDQQAASALAAGRSAEAAELFEDPAWRAAAQFQAGRFADAARSYEQIEGTAGDYNRGNALARSGDLRGALAAYDEALAADPNHADARFNRDLVDRLLRQKQEDLQPQDAGATKPADSTGSSHRSDGSQNAPTDPSDDSQNADHGAAHGRAAEEAAKQEPRDDSLAERVSEELASPSERADEAPRHAVTPQTAEPLSEEAQAREQRLRRIPDDPGGLLRARIRRHYAGYRYAQEDFIRW